MKHDTGAVTKLEVTLCRLCKGKGGVTEEQGDGCYVGLECPQCGGHGFSQEAEDELWTVIMDAHGPDSNAQDYAKAALLWFARHRLSHSLPGDGMRETLERAKIKLRRYMDMHGPNGINPDTYIGGYQAEIDAVLKTIDAALTPSALSGDAGEGE